jgi:hypothetical protein
MYNPAAEETWMERLWNVGVVTEKILDTGNVIALVIPVATLFKFDFAHRPLSFTEIVIGMVTKWRSPRPWRNADQRFQFKSFCAASEDQINDLIDLIFRM